MPVTSILSSTALTTYAAAKARINAIGTQIVDSDHQNEVERIINAVSDAVCSYCGRQFAQDEWEEVHAPPRGERLVVDCPPVSEESGDAPTATLDGSTIAVTIEDAAAGFLRCVGGFGGEAYEESVGVTRSGVPGTTERVLVVTYTGGYVLPSAQSGRNLPWDIEEAVIIAVTLNWKWRVGGYASDLAPEGGFVPMAIRPTLDAYRRVM